MEARQFSLYPTSTPDRWTESTCGLCSIGCRLDIATADGEIVGVRGVLNHPVNAGGLHRAMKGTDGRPH
jgi:ferredoxin-nitrate reductase